MYYTKKIPLVSLIIVASSQITLASDKKAGLPQLDFDTYPSLIFWSIISLVIGYFLMAYLVTPQIKSIINLRETNIQNDLIKAKTSSEESEKIKNEISKNQAEIKLNSQTLINEALLETKKLLDKSEKKVSEKIELRITKAEHKINETKLLEKTFSIKENKEITIKVAKKKEELSP